MQYLPVDTTLVTDGSLLLILGQDATGKAKPDFVGPLPEGQERGEAFSGKDRGIEFQFPPRVVTDNRSCTWNEALLLSEEPLAILAQSSAREISMEWTYIVDGGKWTTQQVQNQVLLVRKYFGGLNDSGPSDKLVVTLKIWKLGGTQEMTFRMSNGSVKHGDVLVVPASGAKDAYPLRTDISITLLSWTAQSRAVINKLIKTTPDDWF